MLIASWNVNSVRARIENIKSYLLKYKPDILMMQEIKTEDVNFPYDDFSSMNYENILIDNTSADLLKGSEVDYVSELIGEQFKITNPQTKSSCGCGVSFSI